MEMKSNMSAHGQAIIEKQLAHHRSAERSAPRSRRGCNGGKSQQQTDIALPIMLPPRPPIVRQIYNWFGSTMMQPNRFQRWFIYWYMLPLKASTFATAFTNGKVTDAEYAERWKHCDTCPRNTILLKRTNDGFARYHYCASCGCWMWKPARLTIKNRLRGWYCPERKHAGPYPGDEALEIVNEYNAERLKKSKGVSSGGK